MSDDISDGHATSSSSTGSDSDTMTGEEPDVIVHQDVIVHNADHNFQLDSTKTSMILMVFSVRFATVLNLKVGHPALCSGSTVTSVVCGCTIIVSSRKKLSVANMCAVIVQQIVIELLF